MNKYIFYIACLLTPQIGFTQTTAGVIELLVRADDMGCTHATNTGIMKSVDDGIATTVEVLVVAPWLMESVELLQNRDDIDIGVHLSLTSEWTNLKWRPLTKAPALTDSLGYFYPFIWGNSKYPERPYLLQAPLDMEAVEAEMRAQIELALKVLPATSHLTAHMGCLMINEETRSLLVDLSKEYQLKLADPGKILPLRIGSGLDSDAKEEALVRRLEELPEGRWMLVTHPADDQPEQEGVYHLGYENVRSDRAGDMQMLRSEKVKEVIRRRGIRLINYVNLDLDE